MTYLIQSYLRKFGYFDDDSTPESKETQTTPENRSKRFSDLGEASGVEKALRKFQALNHLPITGRLIHK